MGIINSGGELNSEIQQSPVKEKQPEDIVVPEPVPEPPEVVRPEVVPLTTLESKAT